MKYTGTGLNCKRKKVEPMITETLPQMSVIVLCYKNKELLWGMLDSIFAQNYPNIQLIVSDDCSDDFDCDEVEDYIEKNKRCNICSYIVRKNQKNQKTVAHLAGILPLAQGEYVAFSAADDRFVDSFSLLRYAQAFEKKPEAKWCVAKLKMTTPDYQRTIHVLPGDADIECLKTNDSRRIFSRWSRRGMAVPCCMCFRKGALELAGGIDLSYVLLEDWPLVLHLLLKGYAPVFVDDFVALHSTGGVTNSNSRYGVESRKVFYDDKYRLLNTITAANIDLLEEEDKLCYKQYMHEIMDRMYFLNVELWAHSKLQIMKMCIQKPVRFYWMMESKKEKLAPFLQVKKLILLINALIICSCLLYGIHVDAIIPAAIFSFFARLYLVGAFTGMAWAVFGFVIKRVMAKKAALRASLVN